MFIEQVPHDVLASTGPTWEMIALGLVSILVAIIGGYARGVRTKVEKLETRIETVERSLLREYHTKVEISELLASIKESIRALHERFDRAGFPHIYTKE